MTREEWKSRAANHYAKRLEMPADKASAMAQKLYDSQGGEFCNHADYDPEACVDDDINERECADGDETANA